MADTHPLLDVRDLHVRFRTPDGLVHAVNGVDFALERGRTLGLVGESGSGKSQTVLAMMGLLAPNGVASGRALHRGRDLLALPARALDGVRGDRIAMIFQDPMTSLNPYLTIERQMTEVLQQHRGIGRREARAKSLEMLDAVRIPDARRRIDLYPHEFSGGMRQRVMIAMALLCEPELLIADEPTTALDATVQARIVALLRELQQALGMAILMITHDLGVVAGLCDRVIVLYGGRVMEQAGVDDLFHRPTHPYTRGLLAALPRVDGGAKALASIPGQPPDLQHRPAGCPFAPRCRHVVEACRTTPPTLAPVPGIDAAWRACHRPVAELDVGERT